VKLFAHQLRAEQLVFWRTRDAAIFIFVFPIMLFLLLGAVYGDGKTEGVPTKNLLLAGMIGYGCMNTALAGLAITLVIRRESALLKRLRATPLTATTYIAAVLVSTLIVFALQTVVLVIIGKVVYGTKIPSGIASLIVLVIIGAAVFAALGVALASVIRSAEGSSAVVNVIILPVAFLSAAFGPTRDYPLVLRKIGEILPLRHFINLVYAVYLHGHQFWSKPESLAVLAAWGIGGLIVAMRRFRWEPVGEG
jgi:ABC-2 type transport system permease protein